MSYSDCGDYTWFAISIESKKGLFYFQAAWKFFKIYLLTTFAIFIRYKQNVIKNIILLFYKEIIYEALIKVNKEWQKIRF